VDASDTFKELQELRRGRGLDAHDLHGRVGPRIRQACGITETDSPAVVRRKVLLTLTELCSRLPDDLRLAALVALALHQEATNQTLDRRVAWLADHFDHNPKTARRRIDEAFRLIAEQLDDQDEETNGYAPSGWYVQSLRSVLRMDLAVPQLDEERRIIATVDELDELVVSLSAPREANVDPNDHITAEMIYGGEIVDEDQVSRGHATFTIRLPNPLHLGQPHDYRIQFTSYPRSWMRPYYVLTPLRRCDHFTARVRFGNEHKPERVWRISGVPPRALDDFTPNGDLISIDRVGDVPVEFYELKPGLSYGLQWRKAQESVPRQWESMV